MKSLIAVTSLLALAACASPGKPSGFLSSYQGLETKPNAVRTSIAARTDDPSLAGVRRVLVEPTAVTAGPDTDWMTPAERAQLQREVDAQLCFELTERYDLAATPADADARVRAAVTRVRPTGRVASAAAAAAGFFIPGPLGVRAPGSLGALGAEAEMLGKDDRQLAALTWNRSATPIGTDTPSLNRMGDALQFAEPFADAAAAAMTPAGFKSRPIPKPDPCAQYGARMRVEGMAASFATGLYVPEASAAKAGPPPETEPAGEATAGPR